MALATQFLAAKADTQDATRHAFAILLLIVPAVLGLNGVLVLLATQEPAQELALLGAHALQPKQKIAGTVQHLSTLTALDALKVFSPAT